MGQAIFAGLKQDVISLLPLRQRSIRRLAPLLRRVDDLLASVKPDLVRVHSVVLVITGDCNIHCVYCEYPTRYRGTKEFSAREWTDLIGEMRASGVTFFSVLGGEPLLRPDWVEIVDACLPSEVSLTTNGTFITEKIADKIAQRFRRVRVSLDASNAATYQLVRRNERFQHVIRGIGLLKDRGVHVEVSYVIVDLNVSDIAKAAQLAAELEIPITYSIVGFENNNQTATQDRTLMNRINKGEIVSELRAASRSGAVVSINHKIVDFLLGTRPDRCAAPAGALMVDGLGDVYPCCGPTPPIGNVRTEPWVSIKARHDASWECYRRMEANGCERCDAAVLSFGFVKAALGRG